MSALKLTLLGVEALSKSVTRTVERASNKVGYAVGDGAKTVRGVALDLYMRPFAKRAQWRNVQDYRRRARITPRKTVIDARIDLANQTAIVAAAPHPTTVTPAVKAVAARVGRSGWLRRRALYVARGRGRRNKRGHEYRDGLQKVSFSEPWMKEWSRDKNVRRKQTIRMGGEILRQVIMKPALDRSKDKVLDGIRKALEDSL